MTEEEEYGEGQKKTLKDYWHLILIGAIAILFWAIYHGRLPPIVWDRATVYVGVMFVIYLFANTAWWAWENFSPKFIGNPICFPTDGEFDTVGDYALFIPAIDAFGVKFKVRNKTAILPTTAINKRGRHVDGAVRFKLTSKEKLPPIVHDAIESGNYPEPFFMGYLDEEAYKEEVKDADKVSGLSKPTGTTLVTKIEEQNKLINMYKKYLTDVMGVKEDFTDWWKRISKKEGFWESLKEATMEKE